MYKVISKDYPYEKWAIGFFNKIGWNIVQKTCKHENKYNKWTDYQDRYYEDYCPDCKLTIYEGMD